MTRFWRFFFWALLAGSLLANAVALGLFLRLGGMREAFAGGGGGFQALPAGIRSEFRGGLRERRAELLALLSDLGAARQEMFAAGAARPYDRARVEAAMARVREASAKLQAAGQDLLLQSFDRAAGEGG